MSRKQEENINISITIEFTLLIPDEVPNVHVSYVSLWVFWGSEPGNNNIFYIIRIYFQFKCLKPNKAEMTEIL